MNLISEKDVDYLFKSILLLENVEELKSYFEDVCTVKEIYAIAQRATVAKMLKEGKTFNEIADSTGASSATISRVNRSLTAGKGYKIVFERQEQA